MATANRKCPEAGIASGLVPVCHPFAWGGGNSARCCCSVFSICSHNASFFVLFFTAEELNQRLRLGKDALSRASPEIRHWPENSLSAASLVRCLTRASPLCATSFTYFLIVYCPKSLWSQNISRCPIIFTRHGSPLSLRNVPLHYTCRAAKKKGKEKEKKRKAALKCTSPLPNPPQWRCTSACFCTFPLMAADGYWVESSGL